MHSVLRCDVLLVRVENSSPYLPDGPKCGLLLEYSGLTFEVDPCSYLQEVYVGCSAVHKLVRGIACWPQR